MPPDPHLVSNRLLIQLASFMDHLDQLFTPDSIASDECLPRLCDTSRRIDNRIFDIDEVRC